MDGRYTPEWPPVRKSFADETKVRLALHSVQPQINHTQKPADCIHTAGAELDKIAARTSRPGVAQANGRSRLTQRPVAPDSHIPRPMTVGAVARAASIRPAA
jgi:hypothetical protein